MLLPLAAFAPADLAVLAVLAAFSAWGVWRGTLRLVFLLVLLWVAFPIATRFGPRFEDSVVKAVSASGSDVRAVAWLSVFAGVLLAGGVVLALLQPVLGRFRPGGRASAALFGLVHGAVVLTVIGYALLMGFHGPDRPAWIRQLEGGRVVQGMQAVASILRQSVSLPPWLEKRLDETDRRVDAPVAESAPSVRPRAMGPPIRRRPGS